MRAVLLVVLGSLLAAAEPTPPVPAKGDAPASAPVDRVTARRAEEAADAFLADEEAKREPASTEALAAMGEVELRLLEARTFLDQGQARKAGAKWFEAQTTLRALAVPDRKRLGERYAKARVRMDELGQALLETEAVDPGSVPRDPGEPAVPAGRPPAEAPEPSTKP